MLLLPRTDLMSQFALYQRQKILNHGHGGPHTYGRLLLERRRARLQRVNDHRWLTWTTMAFPVYPTTHFVLARQSLLFPEGVTLDVPLHIVRNITPRPVKWLRYASWAILHLEGTIYQNDRLLYDNDTIEDGVECLFMPGEHSPQLQPRTDR